MLEAPIAQLEALLFPEKTLENPNYRVTNTPEVDIRASSAEVVRVKNEVNEECKSEVNPEYMQNIYINYPGKNVLNNNSFKTVVYIKKCNIE